MVDIFLVLAFTKSLLMKINVTLQDSYSRGELILRTLFGWLYILIPHLFVLIFVQIGVMFVNFISFWAILILGRYPRGMWDFVVKWMRWNLRLAARTNNLADGYPGIGLNVVDDRIQLEIEYPETSSRGLVLLRTFFGFLYILIPHGICLLFLSLAAVFVRIIAFWIVLITGKYPAGMHEFMVGVLRWNYRVLAYYYNLTDTYPPFSLKDTSPVNNSLDSNI